MKKILLALSMMIFSSSAFAGLMLEPYISYATNTGLMDAKSGLKAETSGSGMIIGGRLGYTFPALLWIAADLGMESGSQKTSAVGLSGTDNYTRTTTAAVVGINFPILFRAWLGYNLMDNLAVSDSIKNKSTGGGYKAGIGFTGLPFVSINLELLTHSPTDYETTTGSGKVSDAYNKYDSASTVLGVSLPFDL